MVVFLWKVGIHRHLLVSFKVVLRFLIPRWFLPFFSSFSADVEPYLNELRFSFLFLSAFLCLVIFFIESQPLSLRLRDEVLCLDTV